MEGQFKPKLGEDYFLLHANGDIQKYKNTGDIADQHFLGWGRLIFETRADAEKMKAGVERLYDELFLFPAPTPEPATSTLSPEAVSEKRS